MINSIRTQADKLNINIRLGEAIVWLFAALFYALGWVVGFVWRAIRWAVAAIIVGFEAGKG